MQNAIYHQNTKRNIRDYNYRKSQKQLHWPITTERIFYKNKIPEKCSGHQIAA